MAPAHPPMHGWSSSAGFRASVHVPHPTAVLELDAAASRTPHDDAGMSPEERLHLQQIRRLARELDEEERELWKQLRRKRDFEDRVAEKRAQLAELSDRRRSISAAHAEAAASVERLTNEVRIAKGVERELGHDVMVLKESNRILQGVFRESSKVTGGNASASNAAATASSAPSGGQDPNAAPEESAQLLHEQIEHLRGHLDRLFAEKNSLQTRQQALFDKQRSAEQDRNRLLSALQDDRKRINELRSERIALWEERCAMEREITKLVQEAAFKSLAPDAAAVGSRSRWASPPRAATYQPASVVGCNSSVGFSDAACSSATAWTGGGAREEPAPVSGGLRVPAVRDTPASIAAGPSVVGGGSTSTSKTRAASIGKEVSRAHWTSFDGGSSAARENSRAGDADPSPNNGGITEWADRLRDYRAARAGER